MNESLSSLACLLPLSVHLRLHVLGGQLLAEIGQRPPHCLRVGVTRLRQEVGMAAFEWAAQRFSGSENASLAACLAPVVEPFRA